MRIALCQFNPVIGYLKQNATRILQQAKQASKEGATLAIFPELAICGYPPKDLLLRSDFHAQVKNALQFLAEHSPIPILIGAPIERWNAAVLCEQKQFRVVARKTLLPNYNVFDEQRYFEAGLGQNNLQIGELNFGITICEDAWNDRTFWPNPRYDIDPVERIVENGADVIINIAASPFSAQKPALREKMLCHLARRHKRPLLVIGQVGANDHLIFDGASCAINAKGKVLARQTLFEEGTLIVELPSPDFGLPKSPSPASEGGYLLIDAISLAIRDYVHKSNCTSVLIGLSGGIDSAVTAALAVKALGAKNVHGVRLPSQYSSSHSMEDAQELAKNLGISLCDVPIENIVDSFRSSIKPFITKTDPVDIYDQNLQARTRGVVLMALSNLNNCLVLSTGNKSELAMGYATLYGDMCGALAPLGDVYKTDVYAMAKCLEGIPQHTIDKAPSAELKPNQSDQDTLPDYALLDAFLKRYIDQDMGLKQIELETKIPLNELSRLTQIIHRNEYKRKQSAIVPMVSERQFGDSRRWPIAHFFDLSVAKCNSDC